MCYDRHTWKMLSPDFHVWRIVSEISHPTQDMRPWTHARVESFAAALHLPGVQSPQTAEVPGFAQEINRFSTEK